MTYKKLYEDALFKLEHNKITLGEFEEMTKPLEREVEQEPILDKIRAEIGNINLNEVAAKYEDGFYGFQREVIKILDKYKSESGG